jgi:hypothetical protein
MAKVEVRWQERHEETAADTKQGADYPAGPVIVAADSRDDVYGYCSDPLRLRAIDPSPRGIDAPHAAHLAQ